MNYSMVDLRWPVQDWSRLAELMGDVEANIAGSYAAWHMCEAYGWNYLGKAYEMATVVYDQQFHTIMPAERPNDIDIFTYNQCNYDKMVNRLVKAGFEESGDSTWASSWTDEENYLGQAAYSHLRYVLGGPSKEDMRLLRSVSRRPVIPIQLIKPVVGSNLTEVLDNFDFYACKVGLLGSHHALVHAKTVDQINNKIIETSHPEQLLDRPFYVLHRMLKYVSKGYKFNYLELYKLVVTAQASNPESVQADQLREMVHLLGRIIHNGELLPGRGEDLRQTFEDVYREWISCIRKKNAII